ncbi:PEP-CTERM sorting domain-containing protein [Anabaena minutissima FACHB-250]|nr:PEP-CTERM sorting domain-containing protein [Anabaena minutissima FACHB-250]
MAAATVTAVSFAPSAAYALTLNGDFTVDSDVIYTDSSAVNSPSSVTISWKNNANTRVSSASGSFIPLLGLTSTGISSQVNVNSLSLTRKVGYNNSSTYSEYTYAAVDNFLTFTNVVLDSVGPGTLEFDLDAGEISKTLFSLGNFRYENLTDLVGTFRFFGDIEGSGVFSATGRLGRLTSDGSGSVTIAAVPEPLTMGGLAIGAGFGAFLKKRYSKKEKQLVKA